MKRPCFNTFAAETMRIPSAVPMPPTLRWSLDLRTQQIMAPGGQANLPNRMSITPQQLIVAATIYLGLVLNTLFFADLFSALELNTVYQWAFAGAVVVLVLMIYALALTVVALPYVLKPVIMVLVLITAGLTYFMREYGVVIDINMVRNTFETDAREAGDLMTTKFFLTMAGLGALPALAVALVPVRWPGIAATVTQNFRRGFAVVAVSGVLILLFLASFSSFLREHKPLLLKLAPSNAISATLHYAALGGVRKPSVVKAIATDARKSTYWQTAKRPAVVVLVIGETARADRFSLNGYQRPTNPKLAAINNLVSFKQATSCGTDTAESVPCIFSGLGRAGFTHALADAQEGLLDVVKRAGFEVLWRENQSGCKGACDRVHTETTTHDALMRYCSDGECHDEILADRLAERVRDMRAGGLIALHMMGSHGPAYYKRYPANFRAFTPTCETSQFSRCSDEEISNTYDNTIVYTDHVLADIIGKLKEASDAVDTVMLYASDHGESLGEHGLYLHGMPYALTPEVQTHIPMLLWMSDRYAQDFAIDRGCLLQRADAQTSHDAIFPTVLAMLSIETKALNSGGDLLAPCRARSPTAVSN